MSARFLDEADGGTAPGAARLRRTERAETPLRRTERGHMVSVRMTYAVTRTVRMTYAGVQAKVEVSITKR